MHENRYTDLTEAMVYFRAEWMMSERVVWQQMRGESRCLFEEAGVEANHRGHIMSVS